MEKAKSKGVIIHLPVDFIIADKFAEVFFRFLFSFESLLQLKISHYPLDFCQNNQDLDFLDKGFFFIKIHNT